jgi:hypothetical protein
MLHIMKSTTFSSLFNATLLLMVLSGITFACCKNRDDGQIVIKGRVLAYGTNEAIAGASIYMWCYSSQLFGPSGQTFFDSLVTDDNGAFYAEFDEDELCGGFFLSVFKEGYHYRNDIDIHSGVNEFEVILNPEAWLKIVTIPDLGGDNLIIGGDFLGAAGYSVSSIYGVQESTFPTTGNTDKVIFWRPWGELNNTKYDTIYLPGLETTTYTLHY